jgi:hypothetical protein
MCDVWYRSSRESNLKFTKTEAKPWFGNFIPVWQYSYSTRLGISKLILDHPKACFRVINYGYMAGYGQIRKDDYLSKEHEFSLKCPWYISALSTISSSAPDKLSFKQRHACSIEFSWRMHKTTET